MSSFINRKGSFEPLLIFCYEVCLTLGSLYQAANANCESFAFTFFASTTGSPLSYGFCFAELSTNLLVALSNLYQAHHKETNLSFHVK